MSGLDGSYVAHAGCKKKNRWEGKKWFVKKLKINDSIAYVFLM